MGIWLRSTFVPWKSWSAMIEAVDERRSDLKDLAESALSCNWIAEALLEAADTET